MKMSPISVFGNLGFLCSAEPGEATVVPLMDDGTYSLGIYYFYSGYSVPVVVETNETLPTRFAGWLNTEHTSPASSGKSLRTIFPAGAKWYCIPSAKNSQLPTLQSLIVEPNQEVRLFKDDKIFVVDGSITIKDKGIVGPKAVKISADTIATANTRVYALKFL